MNYRTELPRLVRSELLVHLLLSEARMSYEVTFPKSIKPS